MAASLVLVCAVAFGFCIRTEPAVPSAHVPFDLVYEGHWPDTSVPNAIVSAEVDGRDIRIRLDTGVRRGHYVQTAVSAFAFRVPAQRFAPTGLAAATYRVLVEVDRDNFPEMWRYEATFGLIDVGAQSIAPRTGLWRVVEPELAGRPPRSGRDAGTRIFVDPRPDRVRIVASGSIEDVKGTTPIGVIGAHPTWAEGWLRSEPRHVDGWLRAPLPTRLLDGRFRDWPYVFTETPFIAIEWTDSRNGVLYLRSNDRVPTIRPLRLVFGDGLLGRSDLARRWLLTRTRGDVVTGQAIVVLEDSDLGAANWTYHDARSDRILICQPVRDASSPCVLVEPRGGARATLECGADGCDGQDTRGARVVLTRWE